MHLHSRSKVLVAFLLLLVCLIGCGGGKLSEKEALSILQNAHESLGSEIMNLEVISIGKCREISVTAEARGITDAYLVETSYDVLEWGWYHVESQTKLIFRQHGEWRWEGALSSPWPDECP